MRTVQEHKRQSQHKLDQPRPEADFNEQNELILQGSYFLIFCRVPSTLECFL